MKRCDVATAIFTQRQRLANGLRPARKAPLYGDQPVVKADCFHLLLPHPIAFDSEDPCQGGIGSGEPAVTAGLGWSFDDPMAALSDMGWPGMM